MRRKKHIAILAAGILIAAVFAALPAVATCYKCAPTLAGDICQSIQPQRDLNFQKSCRTLAGICILSGGVCDLIPPPPPNPSGGDYTCIDCPEETVEIEQLDP